MIKKPRTDYEQQHIKHSKQSMEFCNPLRDFGVGYGDYLEQLTYLLFLKMADEYSKPSHNRKLNMFIPGYWPPCFI